jgi:hypothetical protein
MGLPAYLKGAFHTKSAALDRVTTSPFYFFPKQKMVFPGLPIGAERELQLS